ncbi:hypothetical protein [Sorangium cellulosum]|uniref:Uncharacterized protein n=1 Tax=Sorangium cellulosum TaxID=56 RepID=A0A150Q1G3_SORCE|nr:hypothetical protein [Sorangium cellulosum]KYF61643.1 hypothetical protein BE15_32835 [Sorangium cellulosum]
MVSKRTHFGRAGEYHAMSELLLRGWNVAVPVVDVGDDAFVIDDRDKTTRRVQVKTAKAEPIEGHTESSGARRLRATFNLSRQQLRTPQAIELFYMLLVRLPASWRFLVIPRRDLFQMREAHVATARTSPGRRPRSDEDATTDTLISAVDVELETNVAHGWGGALDRYLDRWPDELWVVEGGPGSVGSGSAAEPPMPPSAGDPSR